MKNRSIVFKIGSLALLALCLAGPANAIVLSFATNGVGLYEPASQANNDVDATAAVNALVNWYNGGANPNGGSITYSLTPGSGVPAPALPTPIAFGFRDETEPFGDINAPAYSYILGKYGNVAYIFYIGNLSGAYSLPTTLGGNSLSHELAFSAAPRVPEAGTTVALLGLALLGLGALRRRLV